MAKCIRVARPRSLTVNTYMRIADFLTNEDLAALDEKASRKLCLSTTPNSELGASNLASCKSQGLRRREGNKSHLMGKGPESRMTMGGHKVKGKKYGGKIPDWGTRK